MSEALAPTPVAIAQPKEIGLWRSFIRFFREFKESAGQAVSALFQHRLRAGLTVLGIAIGVFVVVGIAALIAGFDESFPNQLSSLGPNTLYVSSRPWFSNGNNWWKFRNRPAVGRFDYRSLQANAKLPVAIAPMAGTQGVVAYRENEVKNIQIRGTVESFLDTGGWALRKGRFLSQLDDDLGSDACVIGADLEEAFFKGGEALGQPLRVGPFTRCTIVGTLVRKGNAFGQSQDALVILPLSSLARSFGTKRSLTIAVMAPTGKVRETEEEVMQVMRTARRLAPDQDDNFSVNRQDKILENFNQTTMMMRVVMALI
ncbi:MAG: ABC transporter permease, partial [Deltaproteobacteria bacterium]|nr:ABC transporter permease [Deltaproteobacteria bacterium]